jgi:hypothetical protein
MKVVCPRLPRWKPNPNTRPKGRALDSRPQTGLSRHLGAEGLAMCGSIDCGAKGIARRGGVSRRRHVQGDPLSRQFRLRANEVAVKPADRAQRTRLAAVYSTAREGIW